ncbi:L,D-transpeptidase family protein [Gramella sp. GC03-9]|uniref:L,D-transpeptidase family protein n=1 Tax=Christiangramia oceanisediminis TaxID=2920386 RepID=A0A9X2I848_9FLAO|nr:L,D-transpeptidase family protein [Gramella oceanisediminis]MCP9198428.1 L,D-transpeptidase family protein [Gramella oceanisediminis]
MRSWLLLLNLVILLVLAGCKEDTQKSTQEKENQTREIANLTQTAKIQNYFQEADSSEIYESEELKEFYRENGFRPVWNEKSLREDISRIITRIDSEGLYPKEYHAEKIQELLSSVNQNSEEKNTRLEILLTDASLKLIRHLSSGKLKPAEIYEIWGTPVNEVSPKDSLHKMISENSLESSFRELSPKNQIYQGLKAALQAYNIEELKTESATQIETGGLIRLGESSERLSQVGKRLTELGLYSGTIDTIYSKELENAVKAFQKEHGLQVDGLLGTSTIANMNLTKKDRYQQILINMERWRWYPRDLGEHYIIINIPDYHLSVVKEKDTISSHKIMVGTRYRQTPVFSDKIEYVVYNPTWTIPPTIKTNDVIPGARKDLDYLSSRNIKIYDKEGDVVDPTEIDWSSYQARNYTYRQNPGGSNPLGRVKIIYPNQYMIYLHDTPSQALFEKNSRAQSSGCVRVQNALDLAKYLLNDQEKYTDSVIDEILASGKTREIPVKKQVKVHHFYWTASVENDSIRFIDDIYHLDKPLWDLFNPEND